MYKVTLRPAWDVQTAQGRSLPPRLVELLVAVHGNASLAAACRQVGLSYRYAWGLLQQGEAMFGVPLVRAARGRGAALSPLGERLVWADRRIAARLSPTLDSLAAELESELERSLSLHAAPVRLQASHGFGVEALRRAMAAGDRPLDLKYRSPDEALTALRAGACELGGLHLPIGELQAPVLAHYRDRLRPRTDRVVHLAMRRQGLVVVPGNPRGIHGVADLVRGDVRFIHRQPGSGTRLLLECLLQREGLSSADVAGVGMEELTHAAVAANVASGLADVGLALEPPARRYGLDFIPLATEQYFFLCDGAGLEGGRIDGVLEILRDPAFRRELALIPGYDPSFCGVVQSLEEAFPTMRDG